MHRRTFLQLTAGAVVGGAIVNPDPVAAMRARFAALEKCDPGCPGWGVFHVEREPWTEIEVCDECVSGTDLRDDDAATLPEAQAALREETDHPILEDLWQ